MSSNNVSIQEQKQIPDPLPFGINTRYSDQQLLVQSPLNVLHDILFRCSLSPKYKLFNKTNHKANGIETHATIGFLTCYTHGQTKQVSKRTALVRILLEFLQDINNTPLEDDLVFCNVQDALHKLCELRQWHQPTFYSLRQSTDTEHPETFAESCNVMVASTTGMGKNIKLARKHAALKMIFRLSILTSTDFKSESIPEEELQKLITEIFAVTQVKRIELRKETSPSRQDVQSDKKKKRKHLKQPLNLEIVSEIVDDFLQLHKVSTNDADKNTTNITRIAQKQQHDPESAKLTETEGKNQPCSIDTTAANSTENINALFAMAGDVPLEIDDIILEESEETVTESQESVIRVDDSSSTISSGTDGDSTEDSSNNGQEGFSTPATILDNIAPIENSFRDAEVAIETEEYHAAINEIDDYIDDDYIDDYDIDDYDIEDDDDEEVIIGPAGDALILHPEESTFSSIGGREGQGDAFRDRTNWLMIMEVLIDVFVLFVIIVELTIGLLFILTNSVSRYDFLVSLLEAVVIIVAIKCI